MQFQFHDGGRFAAGYKGVAGDCVTRAIAIATGKDYSLVYREINQVAQSEQWRGIRRGTKSSAREGVYKETTRRYIESIGWSWTATMFIGSGCKVHLRAEELPGGRLIVSLSKHICAVIDGVIYDTSDPSRNGTRCVYGYWQTDRSLI